MPFQSRKAPLVLTEETRRQLDLIGRSRTAPKQRVDRARILRKYAAGESVSAVARALATNRPRIERCVDKALQMGPLAALSDLPGRGHPTRITAEAKAWVTALACQQPKDLGYASERWTTDLLARHIRRCCKRSGHPSLKKLGRGTVSKILARAEMRPHTIPYSLERRDAAFERTMTDVLCVDAEVDLWRKAGEAGMVAIVRDDEQPGMHAIGVTAPDAPPVVGQHPCAGGGTLRTCVMAPSACWRGSIC